MKKIIVLGSKGMLGQMACLYFSKNGYSIIEFNTRFTEDNSNLYFTELNKLEDGFVINCIGRIKQKSEDAFNLFLSNTIFPLALSRSLKKTHFLIHPSTDCVFDGKNKLYKEDAVHNAQDVYGKSKSLGEITAKNFFNIRTSIIGKEIKGYKSLYDWFLNQEKNSKINGFTNHLWNGLTTRAYGHILISIIENKIKLPNPKKKTGDK